MPPLPSLRPVGRVLPLLLAVAGCTGPAPLPKVLVIGIDGVRPDILTEVDTPVLDGLAAEGAYTDSARTGWPSVSGPGWSSFLTGVWPDKHGVTDNSFVGENYAAFPDFLTRIEVLRPELETWAVVDWAPLGASDVGAPPLSDAIDRRIVLDGYASGWSEADDLSVDSAVAALTAGDPDALFVYLGHPDEASHAAGSIGPEYREAIAEADARVGRLVEAVRRRASYDDEDWLVVVSTDHGRRADGGHGGDTAEERTIFLLVSGASAMRGRPDGPVQIVDVAVTALTHLGLEPDPAWRLDGCPVGLDRGAAGPCTPTPAPASTEEVSALLLGLADAWNRRDADGWVAHFAEESGFTNILGMHFPDRAANRDRHAQLFATVFANSTLEAEVLSVRRAGADAAVAEVAFTLVGYDGLPPGVVETEPGVLRTRLLTVLEDHGGDWVVLAAQNTAILPAALSPR